MCSFPWDNNYISGLSLIRLQGSRHSAGLQVSILFQFSQTLNEINKLVIQQL